MRTLTHVRRALLSSILFSPVNAELAGESTKQVIVYDGTSRLRDACDSLIVLIEPVHYCTKILISLPFQSKAPGCSKSIRFRACWWQVTGTWPMLRHIFEAPGSSERQKQNIGTGHNL